MTASEYTQFLVCFRNWAIGGLDVLSGRDAAAHNPAVDAVLQRSHESVHECTGFIRQSRVMNSGWRRPPVRIVTQPELTAAGRASSVERRTPNVERRPDAPASGRATLRPNVEVSPGRRGRAPPGLPKRFPRMRHVRRL